MSSQALALTFSVVDSLGFAAANNMIQSAPSEARYVPYTLGPLWELLHLRERHPNLIVENWISPNGSADMIDALGDVRESWLNPSKRMGFIRALREGSEGDNRLSAFLMDAQRAARDVAGLKGTVPGQIVAAMAELEGNIHDHSESATSGKIAFRAAQNMFEFVVADCGVGLLQSLRGCPTYETLSDHGKALEHALQDGVSRYGPQSGHGNGFRPIFVGLTNLNGVLRFRTGDHALLMDGTSPSLTTARLMQKPAIGGFFASVAIRI